MSRKIFLTIAACIALLIGWLATFAPQVLLGNIKMAEPSAAANVMARTAGVLLICVGILAFSIRNHGDSPTMEAVLAVNMLLQIMILPIDPMAYFTGAFHTLGSFLPNTIIHCALGSGFAYYWLQHRKSRISGPVARNIAHSPVRN